MLKCPTRYSIACVRVFLRPVTAPPADGPNRINPFLPVPLSPFAALQALTFGGRLAKVRAGSAELFWHGCCGSVQPGYIRLGKDAAAGGLVGADLAGETIEFSTVRNALWLIMIHPE